MKPHVVMTSALGLLLAGCGEGSSADTSTAIAPSPAPVPAPTPTPPTTPAPVPTPDPPASSYLTFAEFYTFRLGRDAVLPSACSVFLFEGQLPSILPATSFSEGLTFRYVLTPQVWAFGGDVAGGFDARDGDPFAGELSDLVPTGVEVGYSRATGPGPVRFSIGRPRLGEPGLDYVRLASVWVPIQGVRRQYHCVIGMPTLAADLQTLAGGAFGRTVLAAQAHVRDGATLRVYSLARSAVTMSVDSPARRIMVSLTLTGSAASGSAPDIALGTFTASAPIDPATGNFNATLTGADRTVSGSISGRLFGPRAIEIGAAVGGSVSASGNAPAFAFAGAVFGVR